MKYGRLLLADRHLGVLGGAHALLHDLFDTVVMVADEQSLVEALAERCPDLVILDLSLPRGKEADLAGRLLASRPDLRLVVLSAYDEASLAKRVLAAGAAGFVVKRAVGTDLLPAVRAALAGGTYVSPAVRSSCDKLPSRRAGDPPEVSR
jgi:DNA-binding NarL/FixJ family response regulator